MEIIDDLQRDGLVIVRSDSRFAYGHDAVLLTDFVRAHAGERYLDIGTGTGILAAHRAAVAHAVYIHIIWILAVTLHLLGYIQPMDTAAHLPVVCRR